MAWNDETDLNFAKAWICAERQRQARFFRRHFLQLGETWQYNFNQVFISPIQADFSPNLCIEQYAEYNPDPPDAAGVWPGPYWVTIPGGGPWYFDGDDYFGTSQKSLWEDLRRVGGWNERPALTALCQAFAAQISQETPNAYPFLSGARYYREDFLALVRNGEKKLWEFPEVTNPPDRVTLYVGRVQPDNATVTAPGDYTDAFFLIEPYAEAGIRCYKLRCAGCCCCC